MARTSTLAKLTRPRLRRVLQRGRLFALLDQARQSPVIWVSAPAGAGKTTLVASYVEQRALPGPWMQLDAGDADAPTFFYYLGLAAQTQKRVRPKPGAPLPLLTPEFLADIPGFARRYFRELFTRLPNDSMVVLDNYHNLAQGGAVDEALAQACEEIGAGANLLVISREEPPSSFSRLRVNGSLQHIGWEPLKLTLEESRGMVVSERSIDDASLTRLHERCGGWVAGLRLLLESADAAERFDVGLAQRQSETLYQYFDIQVMGSLGAAQRAQLLRLAYLNTIAIGSAQTLTQDVHIGRLLESMHRRHLFVVKLAAAAATYRFHDLFRDYLRQAVIRTYASEDVHSLRVTTAQLLKEQGEIEDAVALYAAAQRWDAITDIVLGSAAQLLAMGRWSVVVDWIEQMPEEIRRGDRQLLYWLGVAQTAVNPAQGRVALEAAYDLARTLRDPIGALEVAAAMVQSHMVEYSQFKPMDRWIPVLEESLRDGVVFPSIEVEVTVLAALLSALTYRLPESRSVDPCVERLATLLGHEIQLESRFKGCTALVAHGVINGRIAIANTFCPVLSQLVSARQLPPYSRAWAYYVLCFYHYRYRNLNASRDALESIARVSDEVGLRPLKRLVGIMGFWQEMERATGRDPDRWRLSLVESGPPVRPYDIAATQAIEAWSAMLNGQAEVAAPLAESSVDYFDHSGSRMHRITHRKSLALVYYQAARYNDAQKVLAQIDALEPRELYWQKPVRFAIGALCELAQGNEATARELAKRSLQASRNGNCIGAFVQLRPWAPHFCEFALCHGIEADHVRELIRHYEWPPPSLDVENWPWQVKLQTLGEFVVLRRDVALQFGRKAPRKLLQLLRAIVAFGGKQVPEQRLLDSLWMEQDGDAAYRALAVAIRRLRDLFGSDAAIEHVDGKVSLDPGYVWVDAYAFERRADAGTDMAGRASALELYKGGFFAEEADERWALQYRERLRAKFLRLVQEQGSGLETAQDWDQAASCYAKGIESDDLAESFYQGLMRCQLQLGQRAHALSTYRRMRQLFSVVLGMAPSAESEALFRSLNAEP